MAIANFCSECGERLSERPMRKRLGSLRFRAYCSRCSPRFKSTRLILVATLAASGAIGFAIGRLTTAREPFYYIGTPVESSSSRTSPDNNAADSSHKGEAAVPREQLVISSSAAEAICGARTKSGKSCQRKVKGGGYCWQHRSKVDEKKASPPR